MLAWTLTRPEIHIRAMLAGVAASEITSSLHGGQPDVGRRVIGFRLGDRVGAVVGEPGHERHAEIGHVAAHRARCRNSWLGPPGSSPPVGQ